jgi:hypothetical protein
MPIEDYVRFLREFIASELPSDMILQQHENEKKAWRMHTNTAMIDLAQMRLLSNALTLPWNPRFRDERSCYKYCIEFNCSWHDGLQIDIYPVILTDGYYIDQFDRSLVTKIWQFIRRTLGFNPGDYKAFPLKVLQFEGFDVPVPNEWKKQLRNTYGNDYMDLPPQEKQRPPDDTVPEPNHACSEFDKSGNLRKP